MCVHMIVCVRVMCVYDVYVCACIHAAYLLATFAIMFLCFAVQHVMVFVAWAPGKFILYVTIKKSQYTFV